MTDADALLAAVLAEPDDDGPRLVYADWLEEHGESARAEFVRTQLALTAYYHDMRFDPTGVCRGCRGTDRGRWCRECRLRRRERELLAAHRKRWLTEAAPPGVRCWQTGTEQGWALPRHMGDGGEALVGVPVEFRRGFIEEVRCPLADWLAHGPAVVRRQPVTRVDVTDKSPFLNGWSEVRGAGALSWELPREVYRLLRGQSHGGTKRYESEAAARAALSAALISFARRCAATPPVAGAGR
jgi:uncharacterized protein (TIGR02996 family)